MLLQCLCELVNEAPFLYTTELDNVASLCFRAMDSSNYDVRCDVAKLLGRLLAATQAPQTAQGQYSVSTMCHRWWFRGSKAGVFLTRSLHKYPLAVNCCLPLSNRHRLSCSDCLKEEKEHY